MASVSFAPRAYGKSEEPVDIEINRPTCPPVPVPQPPMIAFRLSGGDGLDLASARGSTTTTVTVDCPEGTLPTVHRGADGETAVVSCDPIPK